MDAEIYAILTTNSLEPFKNISQKYVKECYDKIFKKEKKLVTESRLVWVEENGKRTLQKKTVEIEKEIPYMKDMNAYRDCIYSLQYRIRKQLRKVFGVHYFFVTEIETVWNTKIKLLSKWVELNFSILDSLREECDIPIDEIAPNEFYNECIRPNLLELTKTASSISKHMFHNWICFLNKSYFIWNDNYFEKVHQVLEPFFQEEYLKLRNSHNVYVAHDRLKVWINFCQLIHSEQAKEDIMKHVARNIWDEEFADTFAQTLLEHKYYPTPSSNILDILLSAASSDMRISQMIRFEKSLMEELKPMKEMDQILTLHFYYKNYSTTEFKTDKNRNLFNLAIRNAYKFILKEDMLESLVKFFDSTIRKSTMYESMDLLKKGTDVVLYIEDKDIFMELYQNYMTRRLLSNMEKSDKYKELEEYMISYFKMNHGSYIIYRIETMYNDLIRKEPLSFSGNTSLRTLNFAACNTDAITSVPGWKIPKQLEAITNAMKTAFGKERRLTWVPAHDSITLQTTFNNKPHTLTMTSIQASVLFLFDKKESFTKQEIGEHIGVEDPAAILHSLTSTRVPLLVYQASEYKLVDVLNTPMYHVHIPSPPLMVKKKELLEKVELNRDYSIDSAIVRIMKSRKEMKFTELQVEVIKQLSKIFQATTQQIKKRMEALIEKEYIERDEKDVSLLKYVC